MRPGFPHLSQDFLFLVRIQASERRGIRPDHLKAGNLFLQRFAEESGHAGFSAVEKVAIAALDRQLAHGHHKVRTKHPTPVSKALRWTHRAYCHSAATVVDWCV